MNAISAAPHPFRAVLRLGALFWVPAIVYLLDGAAYVVVGLTSPVLLLVAGRWLKSGRLGREVAA